MNSYIITMFILPPGLSDNDVKLIMKLYQIGSNINKNKDQDQYHQDQDQDHQDQDLQNNLEGQKIDVEKQELKQNIIKHLSKNPSTSLSSLMAYSMIFRD